MLREVVMSDQLRIKLGRLASLGFQRHLCVHGTKSNYARPDELVESAANCVQALLSSPALSKNFGSKQLAILREFLDVVDSTAPQIPFDSSAVPIRKLVESEPGWVRVRKAAKDCLKKLGLEISLDELLEKS